MRAGSFRRRIPQIFAAVVAALVTSVCSSEKAPSAPSVAPSASLPCAGSSVAPPALVFSALGYTNCSDDSSVYGQRLKVTTSASCGWSAVVDAPWLGIDCYTRKPSYTSESGGSGDVWYAVDANRTASSRMGHVTIHFTDGSSAVHTVTQEAPYCRLVVTPDATIMPPAGGLGSFQLAVTPSSCQWKLDDLSWDPDRQIQVSPNHGTGSQRINFNVAAAPLTFLTFTREFLIEVMDVNELSPVATHVITQPNK